MVLAFNYFFREKGGQKIQCSIIRKMVQCVHNHLQDYVNSMFFKREFAGNAGIYKSEAKKIREHNLFWYFTKFFE